MKFGKQGISAPKSKWLKRGLGAGLALVLLAILFLGWWWNSEPGYLDLDELVAQQTPNNSVTGVTTTVAMIGVAETLLNKRGGYLSNDRLPPGVWMDNIPSWEYGALVQVRDLSKALRERFSRSQSQSTEDPDLALAEPQFNFDNDSWILPDTESEYRRAIKHSRAYLNRLSDDDEYNAQFYARSDNLRFWLATVENRLGSLSQRLSASVGQKRLNTDLAGQQGGQQSTRTPGEVEVKTPWVELDDVFYEARGTTWALVHFLRAMEHDFAGVLEKKNAQVSLQQIIRELEATQEPLGSPMVLNGSGFGFLANHSLTMASYISRANAAIIDLRDLLAQG
jgi:hypothetical protein